MHGAVRGIFVTNKWQMNMTRSFTYIHKMLPIPMQLLEQTYTPQRMNDLWIICISIWKDASSHIVAVQNKFKQLTTKASSTNTKVELFCWRKWWFTDSFHVWCLLVWSTLMRAIIDLAEKHKLGKFEKNAWSGIYIFEDIRFSPGILQNVRTFLYAKWP